VAASPHKKRNSGLPCLDLTESLPPSAGAFSRDESHITGQRLAIQEPLRITQEYFRGQRRNWTHPGVGQEQSRSATLICLLSDLLSQVFDFFFRLPGQALQCARPVRSMGPQGLDKSPLTRQKPGRSKLKFLFVAYR